MAVAKAQIAAVRAALQAAVAQVVQAQAGIDAAEAVVKRLKSTSPTATCTPRGAGRVVPHRAAGRGDRRRRQGGQPGGHCRCLHDLFPARSRSTRWAGQTHIVPMLRAAGVLRRQRGPVHAQVGRNAGRAPENGVWRQGATRPCAAEEIRRARETGLPGMAYVLAGPGRRLAGEAEAIAVSDADRYVVRLHGGQPPLRRDWRPMRSRSTFRPAAWSVSSARTAGKSNCWA